MIAGELVRGEECGDGFGEGLRIIGAGDGCLAGAAVVRVGEWAVCRTGEAWRGDAVPEVGVLWWVGCR